jgi:hypothetical protein
MKDARESSSKISLPPRLPQERHELDRAVILLGCRKQAELNRRARLELERLIGVYPTKEEATLWKRILRRACQDIVQGAK